MSTTLPFTKTATVTLNGSGNGTASVGPSSAGESWSPASVAISCTGSIPTSGTPTVFLYAGTNATALTVVDSTYNVTGASSSMISGQTLWPGQQVFAVWSDGPANGVATIVVTGTRKVP
jgi:hypothetical protein